jgi:uncharacterized protein YcbK (DUF882 family)
MGDLSPHFSRSEFDCHDGTRASPDPQLIHHLELLRSLRGKPLRIVSGFRTATYNRRIGGAPHSYHVLNMAADLPAGAATADEARRAGFTGIGVCGGWAVHVDVRHAPVVIFPDC